jgi:uncharacterized protein with HEPN domain
MKPELGDKQRIIHILEAINLIEEFLRNKNFEEFKISKLHQSAVERQLEIIGEASAMISETIKESYPDVDWKPIKSFRNIIAHEYFGVSFQILWGVVEKELPILKFQMLKIQNEI